MNELIDKIHEYLRKGDVTLALDNLYVLCRSHSKSHLDEVVSQITRLKLINSSDRAGILAFEERIRLEAQTSSSILKLINIIEDHSAEPPGDQIINKLKINLDIERKKRIEAESRLSEFERSIEKNIEASNTTLVRDYIIDEKRECLIIALSHSTTQDNHYIIVLQEVGGPHRLPIVVGSFEAQAIAVSMEKMTPSRPLTHDLTKNTIELLNYTMKEVVIDALENGIFYSKIVLINKSNHIEIDCRTADAIALAVRFNVPIFTYKYILENAGVIMEDEQNK
ncbi:MAG: bifunctional nuclease family protein [Saprospiraceae bacterium]|nr:bifunctional nuclease family protein [Saprospiraceae bacterium]